MTEEISKKIVDFFREFSHIEAEVIDVQNGQSGLNALCKLPDGEYQVILNSDYSVRAYYRKKPYKKDSSNQENNTEEMENLSTKSCSKPGALEDFVVKREVKKSVLSNSEKAVALAVKKNPGITSYEISKDMNLKFKILSPILKKLLNEGVIRKDGEKYY